MTYSQLNTLCPIWPHLLPIYPILITTIYFYNTFSTISTPLVSKVGTGRDIRDIHRFCCPKEGDNCPTTYPRTTLETDRICPTVNLDTNDFLVSYCEDMQKAITPKNTRCSENIKKTFRRYLTLYYM